MRRSSIMAVGGSLLLLVTGSVGTYAYKAAAPATGKQVAVLAKEVHERYLFAPTHITIKAGTTVRWTNKTDTEHNVTFDKGYKWNRDFKADRTVRFPFKHAGTFHYHCEYHPYMKGVVVVKP